MDSTATEHVPVPPLNLAANFAELREELLAEINELAASGMYILGPKTAAFEEHLARFAGAKFALGVSSGTDALLCALMALDIGRGDEVILPTFTFFATAGTVHRLGATPVFVDIQPDTYNMNIEQVAEKITPRTKAVIPVHLYGQAMAMRPLFDVVNRHGIAVLEDAAQAIGARIPDYPEHTAGAIGTLGALSFYPTKNLGAMGDAGAILTNDEKLLELCRKIRIHGSGHTYHHDMVGGNFRIDALQAVVLDIKLRKIDAWNAGRRAVADRYRALLTDAGLVPDRLALPHVAGDPETHVYHQFVLRATQRDGLIKHLRDRKIGAGVYYPVPLHQQKCFEHLGYRTGDMPQAEQAAADVLALPIYPELTEEQQARVVAAIRSFYDANTGSA